MLTKEQAKEEGFKKRKIEGKYMMGTEAYHQLGNISSDEYDLFYAQAETDKYWIGNWVTGFGFINVCFPKETSRELTQEEIEKYNKQAIQINNQPPIRLKVD
jgi:hypothetical protein